jgi:hypothetical protein
MRSTSEADAVTADIVEPAGNLSRVQPPTDMIIGRQ